MDYELEDALALRKLKEAAALRGSDLASPTIRAGGQDIVNWLGPMNRLMEQTQGNRMEDEAVARQRELAQRQLGEVDAYNKAVSTPGTRTLSQEGPTADGGNIPDQQIPLSPEAENQRQMSLSMDAMRLPKARAMASQFVQSGVGFPEKQAQLKAQQDLLREQQAARLAAQQQQAAMLEEGRNQRASDANALRMTLASIAASNRASKGSSAPVAAESGGPTGKLQHKGFDDAGNPISYDTGTGALFVASPETGKLQRYTAGEMVPTAQFGKDGAAERKVGAQVGRIDTLLADVKKNPTAFGTVPAIASMLPNAIGVRITSAALTEDQRVARVKVMQEAAQIIHAIYGAALSRGEEARANEWAVSPKDDFETVNAKLRAAQGYAKEISNKPGKVAAPVSPATGGNEEWVRDASGKLVRK